MTAHLAGYVLLHQPPAVRLASTYPRKSPTRLHHLLHGTKRGRRSQRLMDPTAPQV
ncbi:hypothetical protein G647_01268 [Cladophialophora carrionii CBS 160.54]|uniref:Uncharacterized protein n=1 Tax=Cladophialophora carrionii CBS 160.54 TaxID=1279043 RepID=V9DQ84_9EURO|nr:uncharacterized protein G647_01268 [Cladophialophora carrionii CBS 160.54]ETI28816.1 hypothetical protein G647_01268 [Cladophialophora carrionii CBS 160.54]